MAKRLFRVDWFASGAPRFEYVMATTEADVAKEFLLNDMAIRPVTLEEEEAFTAGFNHGALVGAREALSND